MGANGNESPTWIGLRAWRDLACAEHNSSRSVTCWRLSSRVQCIKERHQGSCLGRTQVLSVGWHVPSTLDHLANQLVFGETQSNTIQRRPALTAFVIERMTVVALFCLKNECSPALQGGPTFQVF